MSSLGVNFVSIARSSFETLTTLPFAQRTPVAISARSSRRRRPTRRTSVRRSTLLDMLLALSDHK